MTLTKRNGAGNALNQLLSPYGLYVDDDQTIYIADLSNQHIVEWKSGVSSGRVVAGGNGQGNRTDQLNGPRDVIVDKTSDSLIICDYCNRRVVRWPRQNGKHGEIIILNISCYGLAMDDDGNLYVSDFDNNEVKRWKKGETNGTVVAGGNGRGNRLDQLDGPTYLSIDQEHSIYVSDLGNHRVMKWTAGAKEGIVVAGGQGPGNDLARLSRPFGLVVDQSGTVYVADYNNHRVLRWLKGATKGDVVVSENGSENQANQLHHPLGLVFDRENNLHVSGFYNNQVHKFIIEPSSTM